MTGTPTHNDDQAHRLFDHGVHVASAVNILRPAADCYRVWRRLDDLPRFIDHLVSVDQLDERRSRWTTRGPGNRLYSWEAEIIRDEPGRVIAWKTLPGAEVPSAGTIRFHEIGPERGTDVIVTMEYVPKGGRIGHAVAKALGEDAKTQVQDALARFKQLMETGRVIHAPGTTRPAQPERRPGEDARDTADANAPDLNERALGQREFDRAGPAAPGSDL